jgi:hypothetical protein
VTIKDENAARAFEEGSKLFYETYKHITTITTGAIVLVVTFFDKQKFANLAWKSLAVISIAGFITSTIGSVLLMMFLAKDVSIRGIPTPRDWLFRYGSWVTTIVFIVSIFSLAVFAIKNLL